MRRRVCLSTIVVSLVLAMLGPGLAHAEKVSFLSDRGDFPAAELVGPSENYPDSVLVEGLAGTVRKVSLTVLDLDAADDLDMALVGPDGAQVMLMSDNCATVGARHTYWTFEDEASTPVPIGDCTTGIDTHARFKPTDNDPGSDDFGPSGPPGPFGTSLAAFDGIPPDGEWRLYLDDDHDSRVGFELGAYALNLEVEPPAPAPPTVVQVPAPVTTPAPPSPPAPSAATGRRAAALARCKKKPAGRARRKCRARAAKLPA